MDTDCPGFMDAGSTVKVTMRAWSSLALLYADPSKPAGTAPGATFGGVCPAGCWAGACVHAGAQVIATAKAMMAKARIDFMMHILSTTSSSGRPRASYK